MIGKIFAITLFCSPVLLILCALIHSLIPKSIRDRRKNYKEYQNDTVTIIDYKNKLWYGYPKYNKKISEFPTITFEKFKDFYSLNPDSWSLHDCRVFKNNDDELSFTFTYPEWKKYIKFKNELDKKAEEDKRIRAEIKLKNQQNETTIKILEEVQKDIERVKAESQKNIKDAADLIKGVKL